MQRRPTLPALLLVCALLLAGASAVRAQGGAPPTTEPSPSATTTTKASTTTTSTSQPGLTVPGPGGGGSTSTTAPPPSPAPPGSPGSGFADGGDGDGTPPPGAPRTIPPDVQRLINSVVRSRPNNTYGLIEALSPLVAAGYTPTEAALVGFGQFPVAGPATFVHDWLFPRYVPSFHLHQGTDLFAPLGTPVRAPFDGTLRRNDGAVGGLSAYVTAPDGTFAYMAHLSALFPGQVDGMAVRQGDVVGFVGSSGNAVGSPPHVHFELHPRGGAAVDPKATLDAWVADAVAKAPALVARLQAERQPAPASASVTAVAPDGAPVAGEAPAPAEERAPEALWAVAANPTAGTLDVAADLVAGALGEVDWSGRGAEPSGQAAAVIDPLFPRAFAGA